MTRESPSPGVLPIQDVVAYQDGAVVSKTLLDKNVGTITVFAFASGQGLSEHTAPYEAFIQVLDGTAQITVSGALFRVCAGQMIILPAHQPHSVQAVSAFKMMLVMIRA